MLLLLCNCHLYVCHLFGCVSWAAHPTFCVWFNNNKKSSRSRKNQIALLIQTCDDGAIFEINHTSTQRCKICKWFCFIESGYAGQEAWRCQTKSSGNYLLIQLLKRSCLKLHYNVIFSFWQINAPPKIFETLGLISSLTRQERLQSSDMYKKLLLDEKLKIDEKELLSRLARLVIIVRHLMRVILVIIVSRGGKMAKEALLSLKMSRKAR